MTTFRRYAAGLILPIFIAAATGCEQGRGPDYTCEHYYASATSTHIRDYAYVRDQIFDFGVIRDPDSDTLIRFIPLDGSIWALRVFQSLDDDSAQIGVAHADWFDRDGVDLRDYRTTAHFKDISSDVHLGRERNGNRILYWEPDSHTISGTALAYACLVSTEQGTDTIGDVTGDTLQLQLLRLPNPSPSDPLWPATRQNIYDLEAGGDNFNVQVDVFKGAIGTENSGINVDHQNSVPYLQLLGLDRTGGNDAEPDGQVDIDRLYRWWDRILLVFPNSHPFDSDTGYAITAPDSVLHRRVPTIYNSVNDAVRRNASQYYMTVAVGAPPPNITLEHKDIIPQSETVTVNGHPLNPIYEYEIDYETGVITLSSRIHWGADADLAICYEYGP